MKQELSAEAVQAFLAELSELTRRHGIVIGGCGRCGSPYLDPLTKYGDEYAVDEVSYAEEREWCRLEWVARDAQP